MCPCTDEESTCGIHFEEEDICCFNTTLLEAGKHWALLTKGDGAKVKQNCAIWAYHRFIAYSHKEVPDS